MPVTAGPVPGVTSDLRRVRMDPGRFRSGRWMLLTEGLLVSAFGIGGLVSAALHPNAGPTGAPILGLTSTAPHSAMLLAFGVAAIAAVGKRHAAVAVTALSAVAYTLLLFIGAVATARATPTLFGFHAAGIVLHGLLGVVNFALLMWLIPDELGDEAWVPRRGRDRDEQQPSDAAPQPGAGPPIPAPATLPGSSPAAPGAGHTPSPRSRRPQRQARRSTSGAHLALLSSRRAARVRTRPRLRASSARRTGITSRPGQQPRCHHPLRWPWP